MAGSTGSWWAGDKTTPVWPRIRSGERYPHMIKYYGGGYGEVEFVRRKVERGEGEKDELDELEMN